MAYGLCQAPEGALDLVAGSFLRDHNLDCISGSPALTSPGGPAGDTTSPREWDGAAPRWPLLLPAGHSSGQIVFPRRVSSP